ncbi:MAG: 30S ribosomal protein S6--L-glutamate ligase [Myxococcales bacterium]|nr:30S ribosomal protein S6--L-glutamate ligase [Myxococcales bacterium]
MKIAILSTNSKLYSTRRLKEACLARGHQVRVLDTLSFAILVEQQLPTLVYRGKTLAGFDAVIPRIGASISFFGTAVVRQFEQMGVFTLNSSPAISLARDKLRSIQALSSHAVGLPKTAFVRRKGDLVRAIDSVGGAPVVIKLLEGTQGIGVMLADSVKTAQAIIETLHSAKQNVLIQSFIKESKGRDIRAFVVGNRVVASMRRVAQGDEFRSNVHRGGRAEPIKLSPEYEWTAIKAARVMGLRVAGVDMLEGVDGPKVMEVNSSPGLQGIERASGVDVAKKIVELIEEEVLFPDIDLRERLALRGGYGIMEIKVDDRSPLAHKTLGELKLRDRNVLVLTISRESIVIPDPHGDREILPGDTLLCFGNTMTLKGLAPPRKAKKKKPKTETLPLEDTSA